MASVMLKVYDTWLTRPNQDRTSVRVLGVGKLDMTWFHGVKGYLKADVVLEFVRVEPSH